MKQTNPRFSRTHRGVFVARIVVLVTLAAGIVFVATRGNFTSSASDKPALTTTSRDDGRITPSAKAYASARGASMLPLVCTTDPVVVNNADSGAGSLRQAISDACDASTITFNMSLVTSPITLTSAQLSVSKNLTITGPGANLLTVERSSVGGTPNFRIFRINSGGYTVTISGLTIANGRALDSPSIGGGVWNELSTLNMSNCTISGNTAVHGGGINNNLGTLNVIGSTFVGNSSTTGSGGAISNDNTLFLTNSTLSGNSGGTSGGGGIMNLGTATITNSTLTGNSAGSGGGVANVSAGQANLRNSIIAFNTSNCGGACSDGNSPDLFGSNFTSLGHNIVSSTTGATVSAQTGDKFDAASAPIGLGSLANNGGATQTHALLANSTAIDAGNTCVLNDSCSPSLGSSLTTDQRGAGFARSTDGNGDGTATVDIGAYEVGIILVTNTNDSGAGSLRQAITDANASADTNAINFQAGLTGTITLLTSLPDLSTSMSINGPGANLITVARSGVPATPQFRIFTVSSAVQINGLTISNGINANGGGILNQSNGILGITSCTISGNAADFGGGVRNEGSLTVVNCTISGNTANAFAGGGIINRGSAASATIINSTVSGNQAGAGGGIFDDGITTTLRLTNCTITNNTATSGGSASGLHTNNQSNSSPLNAKVGNTIIAGNTGASPELLGFFTSEGNNLIGKSDGGNGFSNGSNGDKVGTVALPLNPLLGPLANNGGPTQTHALLPSSPALNAGSNTLSTNAGLTTDQRGFPRITNTTVDIGSFESRGFSISATSGTPQSASILTVFSSPLVATVSSAFGEPVAGGVVTFAAPLSGASGTFPGNVTTANATIAASGLATAPTLTANGIAGGPYNVVASLAGGSPSANFSLTNLKGNQTITVNTHAPASAAYNSSFTVAATSSSGQAVSYSSSGVCTNVGATFTMTSGTGTCTVKYDQAGDTNFNAATQVTESVTAQKANQTITVNTHAPASATYNSNFTVAATSSSGLAVSYSSSGVCTNVGAAFTMTSGTGTCTVKYDQAGDTNFNAAIQVTESVTAQKANQTITVNTHAPANATYNTQFTVAATASSTLGVSFSSSGSCTNVGATFTMTSGAGTCTVKYDQAGDSNYNAATQVTESVTAQTAATTTSLSSSLNPSAFGQSVTFTATVTSTAGTPTGTVTFKDNGVAITGCSNKTLASGQATCDASGLAAGNHPITADYSGDTNFATSTGTLAGGQVVTPPPSIQFSSSTYNKSETGPSTNITVTRTGDTTGASSVNFSTGNNSYVPCNTINGVTTQNCDFIISSGTLNFAAGQTSRSFPIIIIDDLFVEGDETLSLSLSSPVGALLGSQSTATLTIVDNDSVAPATNPLDDARYFVRTHYYDFLGRLPDDGGLDYWTNEITQCGSNTACINERRVAVSNAFFYEQEYQQTASFVFLLYRASFGNNQPFPNPDFFDSNLSPSLHDEAKKLPRYLSFARDRVQVVGGSDLTQTQLALANAFVQRPEFVTKYPLSLATAAQFVDAVLATIRNDSGAELVSQRDTLLGHFNTGGRGLVMFHLANDYWNGCNRLPGSPPAPCVPVGYGDAVDNRAFIDAEYNRSFVYSQYSGYLRRDGDIGGFIFWLTEVSKAPPRSVDKQHAMVCSFITSEEYQRRFSSVVTHSNAECGP